MQKYHAFVALPLRATYLYSFPTRLIGPHICESAKVVQVVHDYKSSPPWDWWHEVTMR